MMSPFFSIIIPTYNREKMLKNAMESVLSQTFNDWELIVVDDGSTDGTRSMVETLKDSRIRYIFQKNAERSAARNNGIEHASGKYICFLDSDDHYLPQRLESLNAAIIKRNETVAMYYTGICFERYGIAMPRHELINTDQNIFDFLTRATIGAPQTCISREILSKHKFNAEFRIGEDLELWLRIVNEYPLIYLDDNYTVIAAEHDERSVTLKNFNAGKEHFRMLNYVFSADHPGNKISKVVRKQMISNAYFSMARYNIYNGNSRTAASELFRSMFACPGHPQNKHKIYLLLHLLTGRKIKEYTHA